MTKTIDDITLEDSQAIGKIIKGLETGDRIKITNNAWEEYLTCEVLEKVDRLGGDKFYRALVEDEDGRRIEIHANWRDIPVKSDDQKTPYTGAIIEPFDDTAPAVTYIEVLEEMNDILTMNEVLRGTGIPEGATIHDFELTENGVEIEWSVEE